MPSIHIVRGVTIFPDDETFHVEELVPPTQFPAATLIKVVIEGNKVLHWWQTASAPRHVVRLPSQTLPATAGGD
jgi:hypothetical protein